MIDPDDINESARAYRHLKEVFGGGPVYASRKPKKRGASDGVSVPFGKGRDPRGVGDVLGDLTQSLGWNPVLAQSEILSAWSEVAGEETAQHSSPVGITDGVLTVQCESTAWATQLRLMRVQILTHITRRYPEAGILAIKFLGPGAPSWKRGPRSIPGRGPRDTYG